MNENGRRIEENGRRILEVRDGLLRLEGRFDNLIEIAGTESRRLWGVVEDLQRRVGKLEAS